MCMGRCEAQNRTHSEVDSNSIGRIRHCRHPLKDAPELRASGSPRRQCRSTSTEYNWPQSNHVVNAQQRAPASASAHGSCHSRLHTQSSGIAHQMTSSSVVHTADSSLLEEDPSHARLECDHRSVVCGASAAPVNAEEHINVCGGLARSRIGYIQRG